MTKASHMPPPQHGLPAVPSPIILLLNELKSLKIEQAKTNMELKEFRENFKANPCQEEEPKLPPTFHYRQPSVYTGKRDINCVYEWVHNMNDYLNLTKIPPSEKLLFASTYFDGDARIWFDHTYRDLSEDPTWEQFKAEFVLYWKPWNYKFELWHQWKKIVVTSTVRNFANDLRNLRNTINLFSPANAVTEDDLLERFLQGVTHLEGFCETLYSDFDSAVVAADRADQDYREKNRRPRLLHHLKLTDRRQSLDDESF
ncbi:hypothetical protein NEOLI_003469 [Neolecta irregularis DAH-3]|uniref:Retrotransposon gag domain-containing protein n=1 Tax=Neolecta irregularis (strain DAH-3) TaxID=1198029 RepID=A0A1U7LQS1_NEOID|nr:hypothetical protein NEOLI_003469 [Neolecta irregularis DAH-3]|eukprot:OLL24979.1 hypothetical protein NEOLI_003469 [Neolecta irregularis DAH-3]